MSYPIPKKIVVIGPESTGKSTLCQALAGQLSVLWVPEYAREYIGAHGIEYNQADLLKIAYGQIAQEEQLNKKANKLLICDTDLYVIKIWSEHKYQQCHNWILEQIAIRKYDLYLLTDIDIAWQEDPQREHPDVAMRRYFYNIYKDVVQNSGVPWVEISGNPETRLEKAAHAIGYVINGAVL